MIRLDTIFIYSHVSQDQGQMNSTSHQIEKGGSHGDKKKENQDCEWPKLPGQQKVE